VTRIKLCLLVLLAAVVVACAAEVPVAPVPPLPPAPAPEGACAAAQARLIQLDCRRPDGTPWAQTPAGTPFGEACERAMADGRDWHPECIARIADCSQLSAAYQGALCE